MNNKCYLDYWIHGGIVFDGNSFLKQKSIRVKSGIVVAITDTTDSCAKTINARGCVVSPGFIDVHTHVDYLQQLFNPCSGDNFLAQGVTTAISGNCGFSPLFEDVHLLGQPMNIPINIAPMVGHNTLHRFFLGYQSESIKSRNDFRGLNEKETRMLSYLGKVLSKGAIGLSLGLCYLPGSRADSQFLKLCVDKVRQYDKIFSVHMRNEDENILDSIQEVLALKQNTKAKLHISHLKILGHEDRKFSTDTILSKIKDDPLTSWDAYPYSAGISPLSIYIPPKFIKTKLTSSVLTALSKSNELKNIINNKKMTIYTKNGWDDVIICRSKIDDLLGKSIIQCSNIFESSVFDTIIKILFMDKKTFVVNKNIMQDNEVIQIIQNPRTMIASDGVAIDRRDCGHPREAGTTARFLRYACKSSSSIKLSNALYRLTSLPAKTFNLKRGRIAIGMPADIVIFKPENIKDMATYQSPGELALGMVWVFVNGIPVLTPDGFTVKNRGYIIGTNSIEKSIDTLELLPLC